MTRVMAVPGHRFCGEPVSGAQLQLIAEVVAGYPQLSRLELAKTLCELCNWYRPNGQLKSSECRLLLESLHEQSLIQLSALRQTRPRGPATRILMWTPFLRQWLKIDSLTENGVCHEAKTVHEGTQGENCP